MILVGVAGSIGVIRVLAEDDEDDEFWDFWEKEKTTRGDDREKNNRKYYKNSQVTAPATVSKPTTAASPTVMPEKTYDAARATQTFQEMRDSDGDGLADAYDRYPGKNDLFYVMDSDHDGVSDAEDKHPGDNDFAYALNDANENGIADDVETIIGRR